MATNEKLPPGWHSHVDDESGDTYYYNDDNVTVWNLDEIPGIDQWRQSNSEPAQETHPQSTSAAEPASTEPSASAYTSTTSTSSSSTSSDSSSTSSSSSSSSTPSTTEPTPSTTQPTQTKPGISSLKDFPLAPPPASTKDLPQYTENLFSSAFLSIVFFPFIGTVPLVLFLIVNITWLLVLFLVGVIGAALEESRFPHAAYLLIDFFEMGIHLILYFFFFFKPVKVIFANLPKIDTPLLDIIPYSPTKNVDERKFFVYGLITTAVHHIYNVVWCLYGTTLTPRSGGYFPGVKVFVEFARIVHLCRFGWNLVFYLIMGYVRFNWKSISPLIYGQQVTEVASS